MSDLSLQSKSLKRITSKRFKRRMPRSGRWNLSEIPCSEKWDNDNRRANFNTSLVSIGRHLRARRHELSGRGLIWKIDSGIRKEGKVPKAKRQVFTDEILLTISRICAALISLPKTSNLLSKETWSPTENRDLITPNSISLMNWKDWLWKRLEISEQTNIT